MSHKRIITTANTKALRGEDILSSEITPEAVYLDRRQHLKRLVLGAGLASVGGLGLGLRHAWAQDEASQSNLAALPGKPSTVFGTNLSGEVTSYKDATSYNNYYEFGLSKEAPRTAAQALQISPWSVKVEGLVKNPKEYAIEDLLKLAPMEDRTYRLRCVEGWSMVIPWVGYSLSALIKQVEPLGSAKYVEFVTLDDPKVMPGLKSSVLRWPYTEGLRLDEALNPLTLLTFGMYGKVLPKQNGAPIRLIVPWKYGFKSPKSLVSIRFTETQPKTAWNTVAPREYGFYSNVNPDVDHPRWSQATERSIGSAGLFSRKRPTKLFNGYEAQVGSMYANLDLKRFF